MDHVKQELALFEEQGKNFRCNGGMEQDIAVVLEKLQATQRSSARAAERARTEADANRHLRKAEEAADLEGVLAAAASALEAGKPGKAFKGVAEVHFADQPADGEDGRVRMGRVVALLNAAGRAEGHKLDRIARRGCGADLSEVIAALPRPCDSEPYTCPACGRVGHASKMALAEEAAA